jgi:predicted transcriptional regulator of viral defense system
MLRGMENAYRELAALASGHHGLFRTEHLQPCGVSRQQLRNLVDAGWCVRCTRGVYRVLAAPASAEQEILALVWHHPGPSVASHRSAAYLWRLPGFGHHHPEITIPQGVSRRGGRGTTRGTLLLPDHHMTTRWNIPVTTVDRTIFDLAGVERFGRVERAMDTALPRRCACPALRPRARQPLDGSGVARHPSHVG